MKTSLLATTLSLAASARAQAAPPPQLPVVKAIESGTWTQCAPGQTLNVSIQPETLSLDLPAMRFGAEGHGRTDEVASCQFTMELASWWYKYRVAISGVTYSGHFTADDGVSIYQLGASAVFRYENNKPNPMNAQPYVWNMSSSTMLEDTSRTSIGGDGPFDDDFRVEARAAGLKWSPCFDGGEGEGDARTKLALAVTAHTSDAAAGGGGEGRLAAGLRLDWGLAWQECVPDRAAKNAWGDTRVDDWETCSYRSANVRGARGLRGGVGGLSFS